MAFLMNSKAIEHLLAHRTDAGNAEWFAALHGNAGRFCPEFGRWFFWDGVRWVPDHDGEAIRRMKGACRCMVEAANDLSDDDRQRLVTHSLKSESASRIEAALRLAQSELPIRQSKLDADPWLLGCANGTLDLQTGILRPAERDDYITKSTGVVYDPNAACPAWLRFLDRIMAGNTDVIGFLQRLTGYALTGSNEEHCFVIFHGAGRNGKTTLTETLRRMLGDYAAGASIESFLVRKGEGPRTDIARLAGVRFVSANESDENRRLSEATMKMLTGGDVVVARMLYQDEFEFVPSFKIVISTNHRPRIRGTDLGLWRRIRLVPFEVTIPLDEQDKDLPAKLAAELPGILRWAVDGCLAFQRDGLREPEAVRIATMEYRNSEDSVGQFLDERCIRHPDACVRAGELYDTFASWCTANGEQPLTKNAFGRRLTDRGVTSERTASSRIWRGIGLQTLDAIL